MGKKKRTEIILETDEVVIVRRRRRVSHLQCVICGDTRMLTLKQAVIASGRQTTQILRWAAEGRIHFSEALDGSLIICLASLSLMEECDLAREG